jgi:hypothetical protein
MQRCSREARSKLMNGAAYKRIREAETKLRLALGEQLTDQERADLHDALRLMNCALRPSSNTRSIGPDKCD